MEKRQSMVIDGREFQADDFNDMYFAKEKWAEGNYIQLNNDQSFTVMFDLEPVAGSHQSLDSAIRELETMIQETN